MCNCLSDFIRKQEDPYTSIAYDFKGFIPESRILLKTYNPVDGSYKKPKRIAATYCPFCGEKYETAKDEATS